MIKQPGILITRNTYYQEHVSHSMIHGDLSLFTFKILKVRDRRQIDFVHRSPTCSAMGGGGRPLSFTISGESTRRHL